MDRVYMGYAGGVVMWGFGIMVDFCGVAIVLPWRYCGQIAWQ